eukprot:GHVH01001767.1.p1 GENE.GHVH01001767.1~~GHVH01001767.1.p1  ORF type:complete len:229 (+),score=12.94 GHVH01001767.1:164-850(+)
MEHSSDTSSVSSSFNGAGYSHHQGFPSGKPVASALNPQVQQLFARLSQEVNEKRPANPVFFIVDFLCKHYPKHLSGFAEIWTANPELEKDRLQVVEFFRYRKLPTEIASHFTSAGFDTLETLCMLNTESLGDIERFAQTRWLPGHKIRLEQTFSDIAGCVRSYRQEREKLVHLAKIQGGQNVLHSCTVHGPAALPAPSANASIAHPTLGHTTVGHVNMGVISQKDVMK